jgi:REP element-mobilizing transposase RayT
MSNHIHLIVSSGSDRRLSDIVRDCKKYTSKAIWNSIRAEKESRRQWLLSITKVHGLNNPNNERFQVWQQRDRAINLRDLRRRYQKLSYIHMNPVKAGIVVEPEHYLYSSARNYAGLNGLLEVTLLEITPLDGYMRPIG